MNARFPRGEVGFGFQQIKNIVESRNRLKGNLLVTILPIIKKIR